MTWIQVVASVYASISLSRSIERGPVDFNSAVRVYWQYDPDNSGFISTERFRDLLATHGSELDPHKLEVLLALTNGNADGKICYQDFVNLVRGEFPALVKLMLAVLKETHQLCPDWRPIELFRDAVLKTFPEGRHILLCTSESYIRLRKMWKMYVYNYK